MARRRGSAKVTIAVMAATVAVAGAALVLRAGPEAAPPGSDGPDALWGRPFVSVAVTEGGQPKALLDGARLRLSFHRGEDGAGIAGWRAGCNYMSAPVTVRGDRLDVGGVTTTDMACAGAHHEQDSWTAGFFRADPSWALEGGTLRLVAGDTVLELVRAP